MTELRYPIGKFSPKEAYTEEEILALIKQIESLPFKISEAAKTLTKEQLDTSYRDGGWTIRQVIHHIADSHMNAYIRIKWTLTEETPTIKAYDQEGWANTPDNTLPPDVSIELLRVLHEKWTLLLKAIPKDNLKKSSKHPETGKLMSIERMIALYAWHGDHHLGHVNLVKSK